MTTKRIWITTQFEGFHSYDNAPVGVEFLRLKHRHIFHVKCSVDVFHNDRDIEFILFKRFIDDVIVDQRLATRDLSCEMMADIIHRCVVEKYSDRGIVIEISEDRENGCICDYSNNKANVSPMDVLSGGTITGNISQNQIQQVGIDLTIAEAVIIKPKSFVNVAFNESFDMGKLFGLIVTRSSLSRKGIFCTSGAYDPGFNGIGGCSIYNLSDEEVSFSNGMRVAQMICFAGDACDVYGGHYNKAEGIDSQYGGTNVKED